jgi:hypothetical protein
MWHMPHRNIKNTAAPINPKCGDFLEKWKVKSTMAGGPS